MKPHYDNVLLQLTEEQQTRVYDWLMTLGYTKTLQKLKQPPPDGLGLKTHRSCLHRFFKHYQHQVRPEDVAEEQQTRVYDWLMTLGYTKTLQKLKQPIVDPGL